MWQELIEVLSKILDLYEEVLILSKEKRKALVSVDLKALERIVMKEQLLIKSVGKLEQRRESALTELLLSENITAPHSKLSDLYEFCDGATALKLQKIHTGLKRTLAELGQSNEANNTLLSHALSAVDFNMNRLTSAKVGPTYASEGGELVSHAKLYDFKA